MIAAAGDSLRWGMASRVTWNVPIKFTWTTLSQVSTSTSSTGAVRPEMPALLTNTSRPPRASTLESAVAGQLVPGAARRTRLARPGGVLRNAQKCVVPSRTPQ